MKVVLFLLDAFKEEYISNENTPFLYQKSKEGKYIKKIVPSAGFCERTEIFFGLKPKESGFFTAIGFDSKNSPYKGKLVLSFFGWLEQKLSLLFYTVFRKNKNRFDELTHKVLCKVYFKFFGSNEKLKPYKIPLSYLKYFNLTEDQYELSELDYLNKNISLFKIVKNQKKNTFIEAFTSIGNVTNGTDDDRINLALEASKSADNLFIPVYINTLDSIGHRFGPNSKELKKSVRDVDLKLERAIESILEHDSSTNFVFLGDHGMTKVSKRVDVKMQLFSLARKYNLKKEKDFIFFLDSTLLRVWCFTDKAISVFKKELSTSKFFVGNGVLIDQSLSKKYDLPIDDRRYGDFSWWVNEGTIIFPDFFHNKNVLKGMHGYQPIHQSTYGTCVLWNNKLESEELERLELSQVYNVIKEILINR